MYSKLAFSIKSCLETDIMLVDEVLSVGDEHFQRKSLARMEQLINDKNRTVIIVSHNTTTLRKLCDRVLWMNDGITMDIGETAEILNEYESYMNK